MNINALYVIIALLIVFSVLLYFAVGVLKSRGQALKREERMRDTQRLDNLAHPSASKTIESPAQSNDEIIGSSDQVETDPDNGLIPSTLKK